MAGMKILGYGHANGGVPVSNQDLEKIVDTSDEWIRSKTGIQSRYFAKEKTNADMAYEAAQKALDRSGVDPKQIRFLLVCTFTPDYATPSVACGIAERLHLSDDVMAVDLNGACSGFVYGCTIANALLHSAQQEDMALVVGSEKISPLMDMEDRGTCILFGDGAGALLLKRDDKKTFQAAQGCISNDEVLYCDRFQPAIRMQGQEVYRFAVNTVPQNITDLLQDTAYSVEDIDWFVCHQANMRIIDSIARKLGAPKERFYINIHRYGNTSAASVAICLSEMLEQGLLTEGQKVICTGFGAGLTYGSMLLTL